MNSTFFTAPRAPPVVPDTLSVHLNRQERHSLEVPPSFEAGDSFVIAVTNHGDAGRIHIHLADGLADIASIEDTNFYVPASGTTEIPVSVHENDDVVGKLKLASGYGAVTRWVDVVLTAQDDEGVVIDEELAKPQPEADETETTSLLAEESISPALVGGVVAVLVAVSLAVLFRSVVLGAIVLLVAGVVLAYQFEA